MLTRRRLLAIGGMSLGALALGACTSNNPSTSSGSPGGDLAAGGTMGVLHDMEYLGGGAGAIEKWFADTLAKFQQSTGVKYENIPVDYSNLLTRIQTFNSAQDGPVLMTYFDSYASYQFWYEGNLLPISDFIDASEISHWLAKSQEVEGKTYIAPFVVETDVLVANRGIMKDAGVDTSARFASWDEFRGALDKVKATDKTPFMMGISDGLQNVNLYGIFSMEVTNDREETTKWVVGQLPLDSTVASNWILRATDMMGGGLVNSDAANIPLRQAVERFTSGEAGFMDLNMGDAIKLDPNKFEVIPYYQGIGAASSLCQGAGDGVLITKYGDNPDAGARFIEFMHEPEQLASFHETTGEIPADDRFQAPTNRPALTTATGLLSSDPAPWWPGDYLQDDINYSVIGSNFNKALQGASFQEVQDSFAKDMESFRDQNPSVIQSMEAFIADVEGSASPSSGS
jgi:ABC-type glycerol-3-phosphate transport system substrate-binding protein